MTFQELLREAVEAVERADTDAPIYGISTEFYRMWKAMGGNAKARRRWRRHNVPNSQRTDAISRAEAAFDKRMARELARGQRGLGNDTMAPRHESFVMPIEMKIDAPTPFGLKGDVLP